MGVVKMLIEIGGNLMLTIIVSIIFISGAWAVKGR